MTGGVKEQLYSGVHNLRKKRVRDEAGEVVGADLRGLMNPAHMF